MNIHETELTDVVADLRHERKSLDDYYATVFDRIETIGPKVRAFVDETIDCERVSERIRVLQRRWLSHQHKPPLYGIPVGIKDVLHVDGLKTRAGSAVPPAELTGPESPVVSDIKQAGAIVLGKTVTTEFTHLPTGPTRNPHALKHTPGGSSSGSAAAVSAGLCPVSVGTETIGSVIRPAAYCGVVGFRPSRSRIPTSNLLSLSPSTDTVGLFTQTLSGLARVVPPLVRNWAGPDRDCGDLTVGVPAGPYIEQTEPAGRYAFETHVAALESAGVNTVRFRVFDDIHRINRIHRDLVAAEAAEEHAEWYTRYSDRYSPEMAALIERGQDVPIETIGAAQANMSETRATAEVRMNDAGLDLIVAPPAPGPAPAGLEDDGNPVMNLPWTHCGMPVVTVPAGTADGGLPIGLACIGRFDSDEKLLDRAARIADHLSNASV